MWIVFGIVAIIGIVNRLGNPNPVRYLDYIHDKEIILRSKDTVHSFPGLGIDVALPEGWSYLSRRDDAIAVDLVFVNESQHSIAKVQPFRFVSWPPIEVEIETRQYANVMIEWFPHRQMQVGCLLNEKVGVVVMVMAHARNSQLTESVEAFCDSISVSK